MKTRHVKFAILGGGTAGLSAAIRLSQLGERPLLIEGGNYPCHKICGEFLSPSSLPFLKNLEIHPISLSKALFHANNTTLDLPFRSPAGALSHISLDPLLLKKALIFGTQLQINSKIALFEPKEGENESHVITLSDGQKIEASHVILATGRIPHPSITSAPLNYVGFKCHFKNLPSTNTLEMFSLKNAYLGITPIENNKFNVACLAKKESVKKFETPKHYLEELLKNSPIRTFLSQGEPLFEWMIGETPSFGIRKTPDWKDVYFVGDAAATIPPACGDGLSMAILGGALAAEHAKQGQYPLFKKTWEKKCQRPIFLGKILHQALLSPHFLSSLLTIGKAFPSFAQKIFELTRQKT